MNALTEADFQRAARTLGCDVAAVKAVCEVESPRGGYQPDGQVSILFERHKFSKLTGGVYDRSHPDISNPKAGGYGKFSEQHSKLQRAVELNRPAALMATSWGRFQILGSNWRECGAKSLQDFINIMFSGEQGQLQLFVGFVKSSPARWKALKEHNWAEFARLYNGTAYRLNKYDTKLAAAYGRYAS